MNNGLELSHGGTRKMKGNKVSVSFKYPPYDIKGIME